MALNKNSSKSPQPETSSAGDDKQNNTPAIATPSETPSLRTSPIHEGEVFCAKETLVDMPASERFRILRAKIERLNLLQDEYRVIAVTSAVQSEGKSVVASNFARALSLDPLGKTVLIDCDLRRPSLHNFFCVSRRPGLSDAVYRSLNPSSVAISITPSLDVIPAGSELIDPAQGIERPELAQIIQELRANYRYVIIDCPPVLLCPEPITISLLCDTTVLVVKAWHTPKKLVRDAVEAIGRQRILGVVLNEAEDSTQEHKYYGYYGYRGKRTPSSKPKTT